MNLYPGECEGVFLKCSCFVPDFLFEVIVIFCVLEGLKVDSVVYFYCSWDVITNVTPVVSNG